MSLRKVFEKKLIQMVFEGRLERIKKKYPNIKQKIDQLSKQDPSNNDKYLGWMVKQIIQKKDSGSIIDAVQNFHKLQKNLEKKDLNQYRTLEELEVAIEIFRNRGRRNIEIAENEGTVLYQDDKLVLFRPKNKESVCKFGSGTKWCIASKKKNMYSEYKADGVVFYYLLSKVLPASSPYYKVAIAANHKKKEAEFFTAKDKQVIELNIIKNFPNYAKALPYWYENFYGASWKGIFRENMREERMHLDTIDSPTKLFKLLVTLQKGTNLGKFFTKYGNKKLVSFLLQYKNPIWISMYADFAKITREYAAFVPVMIELAQKPNLDDEQLIKFDDFFTSNSDELRKWVDMERYEGEIVKISNPEIIQSLSDTYIDLDEDRLLDAIDALTNKNQIKEQLLQILRGKNNGK